MELSVLRHLKAKSADDCFFDGHKHHVVIVVKSEDAQFECSFKNWDAPYKVVQLSGDTRKLSREEFFAAMDVCWQKLVGSAVQELQHDTKCRQVSKIIAKQLCHNDWKDFLIFASKACGCKSEPELEHLINSEVQDHKEIDATTLTQSIATKLKLKRA